MWSVLETMEGRVSDRFSAVMRMGLPGAPLLIRSGAAMYFSDLNMLILPGLAALGINPVLHLIDSLAVLTNLTLLQSTPCVLFTLSEMPHKAELHTDSTDTSEPLIEIDPIIVDQSVVMRRKTSGHGSLVWRRAQNAEWSVFQPDSEQRVWAFLTLKRAPRSGLRSGNITAALLRWIAFAAANPDRLITAENSDQLKCAADFITECAGSQPTPAATRLRRCAAAFQSGRVDKALVHLKQAVLIRMGLTSALRTALERPVSVPLTDIERRELIYMARAGTPELKVLAVHRLASDRNREHPDIRITIKQMRYDGSVWVRNAAGNEQCG